MASNYIKVTLVKSKFGRLKAHADCVRGLGLRRIGHSVLLPKDNPCILGMIRKISYLLEVVEVKEGR